MTASARPWWCFVHGEELGSTATGAGAMTLAEGREGKAVVVHEETGEQWERGPSGWAMTVAPRPVRRKRGAA